MPAYHQLYIFMCLGTIPGSGAQCLPGSACPDGIDCVAPDYSQCVDCSAGFVSLGSAPCVLCDEQGKVANVDNTHCEQCSPGTQPMASRSACSNCVGNSRSTFGIQCEECLGGSAVNEQKTDCDDISDAEIHDPGVALEILGGSNVQPVASLAFAVGEAALVDGSSDQDELFTNIAAEMAAALGIIISEIEITGARPLGMNSIYNGAIEIDIVLRSDDAAATLQELISQLDEPDSPFRGSPTTGAVIPDAGIRFTFTCPVSQTKLAM
jgi:hypothetical protein